MPGCGPPFDGLYRSPSVYPFCAGYITFSVTGGLVTQSIGRDGSIGKTLRKKTAARVVPVAHNSGEYWRRNAFLKYPGTITVSIGAAIETGGLSADELNRKVEEWIEAEMRRLDGHAVAA